MTAKQLGELSAFPNPSSDAVGLTKREYFAGQFMSAQIAKGQP